MNELEPQDDKRNWPIAIVGLIMIVMIPFNMYFIGVSIGNGVRSILEHKIDMNEEKYWKGAKFNWPIAGVNCRCEEAWPTVNISTAVYYKLYKKQNGDN